MNEKTLRNSREEQVAADGLASLPRNRLPAIETGLPAWKCQSCAHPPHAAVCFAGTGPVCRCDGQPACDVVCQHGVAADVHCCNCHGGFLFDPVACGCSTPAEDEHTVLAQPIPSNSLAHEEPQGGGCETSMARAVRSIAQKQRMSSLDVPILEDAADHIDQQEQRLATLTAQDAALASELEDLQVAYQREIRGRVGAEYRAALAERNARAAWEAGFRLCRSYGDNWIHFDGEQKERQWQAYQREQQQEDSHD